MNILLIGQPWFAEDFMALGHDVRAIALGGRSDVEIDHIPTSIHAVLHALRGWTPDCILVNDDSSYPIVLGLETLEVPLIWYAVDTHLHRHWHSAYAAIFDVVLVAQRDYVNEYKRDRRRQHVQWLPLFSHSTLDGDRGRSRDVAVSFVGTLDHRLNPDRVRLLESLRGKIPLVARSGPYHDLFNRSLMVLNQCAAGDVNFRTFEAMACGALLLMERVGNGLDELFQDGVHCRYYERGDAEQIVGLVRYYLNHDEARRTIAMRGRDAVAQGHSSRHRAKFICSLLEQLDVRRMIAERKRKLLILQAFLGTVYEQAAEAYRASAQTGRGSIALKRDREAVAARYDSVVSVIKRELGINHQPVPA